MSSEQTQSKSKRKRQSKEFLASRWSCVLKFPIEKGTNWAEMKTHKAKKVTSPEQWMEAQCETIKDMLFMMNADKTLASQAIMALQSAFESALISK